VFRPRTRLKRSAVQSCARQIGHIALCSTYAIRISRSLRAAPARSSSRTLKGTSSSLECVSVRTDAFFASARSSAKRLPSGHDIKASLAYVVYPTGQVSPCSQLIPSAPACSAATHLSSPGTAGASWSSERSRRRPVNPWRFCSTCDSRLRSLETPTERSYSWIQMFFWRSCHSRQTARLFSSHVKSMISATHDPSLKGDISWKTAPTLPWNCGIEVHLKLLMVPVRASSNEPTFPSVNAASYLLSRRHACLSAGYFRRRAGAVDTANRCAVG
jgi:hypothetical protein